MVMFSVRALTVSSGTGHQKGLETTPLEQLFRLLKAPLECIVKVTVSAEAILLLETSWITSTCKHNSCASFPSIISLPLTREANKIVHQRLQFTETGWIFSFEILIVSLRFTLPVSFFQKILFFSEKKEGPLYSLEIGRERSVHSFLKHFFSLKFLPIELIFFKKFF